MKRLVKVSWRSSGLSCVGVVLAGCEAESAPRLRPPAVGMLSGVDPSCPVGARVAIGRSAPRRSLDRRGRRSEAIHWCSISARPTAACGRRRTPAPTGATSPTGSSRNRRSAPSTCRSRIPRSSTSAWASRSRGRTSRPATGFTSRSTAARPGRTSGSRRPVTSRRSASIPRIPTSSMSRRRATSSGPIPTAACSGPGMAARRGRRCCSRATTSARSIWRWIRRTRMCLYASLNQLQRLPWDQASGGTRQRPPQEHRRRRHLDRHYAPARYAQGHRGQNRPRRLTGAAQPRVGAGRIGRRRTLPIRRQRTDLAGDQSQPEPVAVGAVIHARGRRPAGCRDRVASGVRLPEIDGRRQDVHLVADAARRSSCLVDRSEEPQAHDRRQRWWRHDHAERRRHLVDAAQPTDGGVVRPRHRRPGAIPSVRGAERQHARLDAEPDRRGAIAWMDNEGIPAGEGGETAVKPDGSVVYGADRAGIDRYDRRTGQSVAISVWPDDQFTFVPEGRHAPLLLHAAAPALAARFEGLVHRRQQGVPHDRRRQLLGGHQPRRQW